MNYLIHQAYKIILIAIFWQIACVTPVICQTGYAKRITVENSFSLDFDDILYHDDQIIVRGNAFVDSVNLLGLFVAGLDTNGILLWHKTYFDSTRTSHIITNTPSRFIISKKKEILIPSKYSNINRLVLFKTDSLGNMLFSNEYPHTGFQIYPLDILEVLNSIYIFGRVISENYLSENFVSKIDSLGKLVWIKYYSSTSYNVAFGDVIDNQNGTMTISAAILTTDYYNEFTLQGWKRPWLFTIDTSGTIINQWTGDANDERTLGGGPFYKATNGDWIIVSVERKEVPFLPGGTVVNSSPTITKLDSNFNLVWKINLTDFTGRFDQLFDLEYDPSRDEFVAAGDLKGWYDDDESESEAWFVKINSSGEVIWNKTDTVLFHSPMVEQGRTAGLEISPSGSIYAAGYLDYGGLFGPPIHNEGWIIKITPDGCIDTICSTTSLENQIAGKQKNIILYPNPAIDQLHVHLKEWGKNTFFNVLDLNGRNVLSAELYAGENVIQLSLPTGMYFYSIVDSSFLLSSGKFVVR